MYEAFERSGLQYGPGYRGLVQAWGGVVGSVVARVRRRRGREGTAVHPSDLDAALQSSIVASSEGAGGDARLLAPSIMRSMDL